MMESDEPGNFFPVPDASSGSAFETSDSEHSSSSEPERAQSSASSSKKGRQSSRNKDLSEESGDSDGSSNAEQNAETEEQIRRDAAIWAADFQAPKSANDIKSPSRSGSRSHNPRKRKATQAASELRAKRLKPFHHDKYRELLNIDINDTVSRGIHGQSEELLLSSQIGISIWTAEEKEHFYTALQRLGRDDTQGIASRVGTKSEQEVQQYILLLQNALIERKIQKGRCLSFTKIPAALEISNECCTVLEKAGEALSSRQELYEEKVEKEKWGDAWLITEDVAHRFEKYRRGSEREEAIEEGLPATNLFNLRRWLELSSRVFMNSDVDENWNDIAEQGEAPAVRATAFEDFHSLAYNYTKRLVQTTLFTAMSRERATGSKKVKHAEVKGDDVEAAVAILKMKHNSTEFWVKCARRNQLRVVNDESSKKHETMTYDEVESALRSVWRPRSSSRSRSRSVAGLIHAEDGSSTSSSISEDSTAYSDSDTEADLYSTGAESNTTKRSQSRARSRSLTHATVLRTTNDAIDAHDMRASRIDELTLWETMEQKPPLDPVKEESILKGKELKGEKWDNEGEDWRDRVEALRLSHEYPGLVPEEAFIRNRERISKKKRRRDARVRNAARDSDEEDRLLTD